MALVWTTNIQTGWWGGWWWLSPDAEGNINITPWINPDTGQPWLITFLNQVTGLKFSINLALIQYSNSEMMVPNGYGKPIYRVNNIFTPYDDGNVDLPLANLVIPTYGDTSIIATSWRNIFTINPVSWNISIYLNSAVNNTWEFIFKKVVASSNTVTIYVGSWWDWQEYLDLTETSYTLADYETLRIVSDNTWWFSIW